MRECEWCGKTIPDGARVWVTPAQLATSPVIGSLDQRQFKYCSRACAQAEMDEAFIVEDEHFKLLADAREAADADRRGHDDDDYDESEDEDDE